MQPPFQIHLTDGVEILGAHYNYMDHIAKRMQHFCLYTEHFFPVAFWHVHISWGYYLEYDLDKTKESFCGQSSNVVFISIQYYKLCNIRMRTTYCKFISPDCTILHLALYIATGLLNVCNMCAV